MFHLLGVSNTSSTQPTVLTRKRVIVWLLTALFELHRHNVAFISLWPGAIKTEEFFDNIDKSPLKPIFLDTAASTEYVEKVEVLLCKESNKQIMQRSGKAIFSDDIAGQSGIKDLDRS